MVSNDAFVVVPDDEHHNGLDGLPGFARTFWLAESAVDDQGLRFADGLVRVRTVYVEHPIRGGFLLPLAGYHRYVFEDKAMQAVELAAELGARRIEAEHVTGWGDGLASMFGARLMRDGRFVLGADYRRSFTPPGPDGFTRWASEVMQDHPWLAYERAWQAMVNGRAEGTLDAFVLPVTYETDGGIVDDVLDAVEAEDLSAGGSYVPFEQTTWRLHISFDGS